MRRLSRLVFLLSLLIPLLAAAQKPYERFNTEEYWKQFRLDSTTVESGPSEFTLVSNRNETGDGVRFLGERRIAGMLRYYSVYRHGERWTLHPEPTLAAALAKQPSGKDWLLYTEGMGRVLTGNIDRAHRVGKGYDVNVVMLDYPSIRTDRKSYFQYRDALHNSKVSYRELTGAMKDFHDWAAAQKSRPHVSLFFHSMGNNVMRGMARHPKYLREINGDRWADNIVLNAACCTHRNPARWLGRIHFADRIYVQFNPDDEVLKVASFGSLHRMLGYKPTKHRLGPATYINFQPAAGDDHNNFLSFGKAGLDPVSAAHYRIVLHGKEAPVTDRSKYAPGSYKGIGVDLKK